MSNNKYDYLIFGANGQDGFFMTRYLLKKKLKIIVVARNTYSHLENLKSKFNNKLKILIIKKYSSDNLKKILQKITVKKIFFFAGFSKIPKNKIEIKKCYIANFKIFEIFLNQIKKNKKKNQKILYISSSEIFGSNQKKKRNEKSLIKPDNFYGECKAKAQELIYRYRKNNSIFISTAIAYNHESIFSPNSHIIKRLIFKFVNSKKKIIKIFNPNEFRNLSHVYDFLPLFEKILFLEKPGDFILANDNNYKIVDLANIINKNIYNNKYKIKFLINKKITISRKADNSKIKKFFKFQPKYDIYKILKRFNSYQKFINRNVK